MPTASRPTIDSNQVTPTLVRKSSRLRKSKETFDPSVEIVARTLEDSPEVRVQPKPSHDLMIEAASLMIGSDDSSVESSADSCKVVECHVGHPSEAWTKKILFQKWTVASSKATQLKETLGVVKKQCTDLKSEVKSVGGVLKDYRSKESRAEKYRMDVSVLNVEKNALEEEVSFLKYRMKSLELSHKNAIKNIEAEKKFFLETSSLTSQKLLHEEKLLVREQALTIAALEEKIVRLNDTIQSCNSKVKSYDEITAQAVKANIAMNMCKEKSHLR